MAIAMIFAGLAFAAGLAAIVLGANWPNGPAT
jgi:hypothetical protein